MLNKPVYKNYKEIIRQFRSSELKYQSIPTEYYTSLLLPTLLYDDPVYIAFTCPQKLFPKPGYGKPVARILLSAKTGVLQAYIPFNMYPFGALEFDSMPGEITGSKTIELVAALDKNITRAIDENALLFFTGERLPPGTGRNILLDLMNFIDPGLIPVYKSMAPDFFSWMES